MDFIQRKLNASEWKNLEIRVKDNEMGVLKILDKGFNDENISSVQFETLKDMMKLKDEHSDDHIFNYFCLKECKIN